MGVPPGMVKWGRRQFVCAAVVGMPLLAAAPMAEARRTEWCTKEPPVTVWVGDRPVTVNVFVAVPVENASLLHTVEVSGVAAGSTVTVTVVGPNSEFTAYARIMRLGLSDGDPELILEPGATVTFTFRDVAP